MSLRLSLARVGVGLCYLAFTWLSLRGDSSAFLLLGNTLYPQHAAGIEMDMPRGLVRPRWGLRSPRLGDGGVYPRGSGALLVGSTSSVRYDWYRSRGTAPLSDVI